MGFGWSDDRGFWDDITTYTRVTYICHEITWNYLHVVGVRVKNRDDTRNTDRDTDWKCDSRHSHPFTGSRNIMHPLHMKREHFSVHYMNTCYINKSSSSSYASDSNILIWHTKKGTQANLCMSMTPVAVIVVVVVVSTVVMVAEMIVFKVERRIHATDWLTGNIRFLMIIPPDRIESGCIGRRRCLQHVCLFVQRETEIKAGRVV